MISEQLLAALGGKTDAIGAMIRDCMPRPPEFASWVYVDVPWIDPDTWNAIANLLGDQVSPLACTIDEPLRRIRGQFLVSPSAHARLKSWAAGQLC